ncbi:MAG: type II toxin-antitoxin system HicA family toxin [Candidatus Yonathbacteria bacterium]|nr:type II toxin-antitoxin system HicA family toxin [Candidatus Yonathbacteria bacterium]
MPKLPILTPKKFTNILCKIGFYIHHQTGSNINLRHITKTNLHVVIPYHNKDIAPKILKSILLQADVSVEDLLL